MAGMRTIYCSLIACLFLVGCAKSSKPGPQPSAGETPEQAMARFTHTFNSGNVDAGMKLFDVNTDRDRRIVEPYVKYYIALAEAERAMAAKFGSDKADAALHAAGEKTDADAKVATVKVNGDIATITFADKSTVQLKRVKGRWVMPMDESAGKMTDAEIDSYAADFQKQTKAMEEVTKAIKAGKYASADAATAAVAKASGRTK
jgi:hypothetical protein